MFFGRPMPTKCCIELFCLLLSLVSTVHAFQFTSSKIFCTTMSRSFTRAPTNLPKRWKIAMMSQVPPRKSPEESVAEVELKHALNLQEGPLSERLRKTLSDLQDLYISIEKDVIAGEADLAEKKKCMNLLQERIHGLKDELQQAVGEEGVSQDVHSALIVGGGRIGQFLKSHGESGDKIVRSTGEYRFYLGEHPGGQGPIYFCVGNDSLDDLIRATPPERIRDLVLMGYGLTSGLVRERWGIQHVTQASLGFCIPKFGRNPVDAVTSLHPLGHTSVAGVWSREVARRLRKEGLTCRFVDEEKLDRARLAHLAWVSAVMVVGKLHQVHTVGEVAEKHWTEAAEMMAELKAGVGLDAGEGFGEDYTRAVHAMAVVVKELEWRNGFFLRQSKAALAAGRPDPFPRHTAGLHRLRLDVKHH